MRGGTAAVPANLISCQNPKRYRAGLDRPVALVMASAPY